MNDVAAPLAYFRTAGPAADPITRLGWGLGIVSLAVIAVIAVLLAWAIWRKRPHDATPDESGTLMPASGNAGRMWLLVGTGVSTVALLACAIWTLATLSAVAAPGTAARTTIDIRAFQFWWRVRYLDANGGVMLTTANEIHIPVGQPVRIRLTSGDVIHSFWVPALGGKMDAIPGQTNVTWLQGDRVGRFRGQCSEYCGVQHAHMALYVDVDSSAAFADWIEKQRRPAAAPQPAQLAGARVFMSNCAGCHSIQGTEAHGAFGPDLTHLMSRDSIAAGALPNGPAELRQWIAHTQAVKPGSAMPVVPLDAAELNEVLAYLAALH